MLVKEEENVSHSFPLCHTLTVTLHPSPVTVASLLCGEVCFVDEFHGLTVEVDGALVVGQGGAVGRVGEMGREVGEATQSHWRDEEERREERGKAEQKREGLFCGTSCSLSLHVSLTVDLGDR